MFFLAVNIIKKNCVIGKQGFSLFPFFVLGIVPIFANDNYTLTFAFFVSEALARDLRHGKGLDRQPGSVDNTCNISGHF